MTTIDTLAPTAGDLANSYEWLWDITANPTAVTPIWVNVPDITGLTPTPAPKYKDTTTYANKGNTTQTKTGEDFTLTVSVKGVKDETGEFQDELLVLFAAADAIGAANVIGYRYGHATSPSLAWKGTAAVEWSRGNTGNDDPELFAFTLTGQGDRQSITNPFLAP